MFLLKFTMTSDFNIKVIYSRSRKTKRERDRVRHKGVERQRNTERAKQLNRCRVGDGEKENPTDTERGQERETQIRYSRLV